MLIYTAGICKSPFKGKLRYIVCKINSLNYISSINLLRPRWGRVDLRSRSLLDLRNGISVSVSDSVLGTSDSLSRWFRGQITGHWSLCTLLRRNSRILWHGWCHIWISLRTNPATSYQQTLLNNLTPNDINLIRMLNWNSQKLPLLYHHDWVWIVKNFFYYYCVCCW